MAFKFTKSVFMFLAQGGHKEGVADNPDRAYVVFVAARNIGAAEKLAHKALAERGWMDVNILRGAVVAEKPVQQPHDQAWQEARDGRRGIIVYDEKAATTGETGGP